MKKIARFFLASSFLMAVSAACYAHPYGGGPHVGVYFGGPVWVPPPPVYYYPPPPAVVYVAPPEPQTYIEQAPQYRYYCQQVGGYYPQVPSCPGGWMKVVVKQ
jgi:hypothetical protein